MPSQTQLKRPSTRATTPLKQPGSLTFLPLSAIFRNMARSPSFAGVILAAGESSRMGTDKALLPWPPKVEGQLPSKNTFLSAAIRSLLLTTDFVVVVAGKNEAELAPIAYANGASVVINPGDRPPVDSETVHLLRDAFEAAPQEVWAVVPELAGKHGHPYLVGRELIEVFLQALPTASARDVEHRYQDHIQYIEVSDPFVALNINTPDDYAALLMRIS